LTFGSTSRASIQTLKSHLTLTCVFDDDSTLTKTFTIFFLRKPGVKGKQQVHQDLFCCSNDQYHDCNLLSVYLDFLPTKNTCFLVEELTVCT